MTTAYERRIRRDRRRRREARIAKVTTPLKALIKFLFVLAATLAFGAILVANVEANVRRSLDMFYAVSMFFFALWLFEKMFIKEGKK